MRESMNLSVPRFLARPLRELAGRVKARGTSLSRELRPALHRLLKREGIAAPIIEDDIRKM